MKEMLRCTGTTLASNTARFILRDRKANTSRAFWAIVQSLMIVSMIGGCTSKPMAYVMMPDEEKALAETKAYLDQGGDVNALVVMPDPGGSDGSCPFAPNMKAPRLLRAAVEGHLRVAELLIARGADVNAGNERRLTPLHYAAMMGELSIADLLITSGADINFHGGNDVTPLVSALNSALEVQSWRDNGDDRPRVAAAMIRQRRMVFFLIGLGADVSAPPDNGHALCGRPLHLAAALGDVDLMQVMMEKGAPVDTRNRGGQTPLHKAVGYRRLAAAKFLLEKGANPNAEINAKKYPFWSGTPLHEAAENGDAKMFDLLVEYGANINAKDAYGRTPVLKAAKTDSPEDHGVN